MMMRKRLRSNSLLAFCQNTRLPSDIAQTTNDLLIAVNKAVQRVWNAGIDAEVLHHDLRFPEVVTGHAWEQMVDCLEL